jgi:predicted Fe-S protein YdhL (DUF1289 family)
MSNNLSTEKKTAAVSMLCEGNSIRAIERMTGIHRDTIMRLGVRMGEGCSRIMDERFRNLSIPQVQVDEIWGFIGAKRNTAKEKNNGAEPQYVAVLRLPPINDPGDAVRAAVASGAFK